MILLEPVFRLFTPGVGYSWPSPHLYMVVLGMEDAARVCITTNPIAQMLERACGGWLINTTVTSKEFWAGWDTVIGKKLDKSRRSKIMHGKSIRGR